MMRLFLAAAVFCLLSAPALAGPGIPLGWDGSGIGLKDYEFGTEMVAGAGKAAYVKARPGAASDGFGDLFQCVMADNYIGKRLRLSARLKGVEASGEQLWMRVDGPANVKDGPRSALSFYNMADRPIKGTTDWKRYDVVLDVPAGSTMICYGFFLAGGKGEAWADGFSLEPVGRDMAPSRNMATPKAPVNLGFDQ